MANCPNCGRKTRRTKDWVCQWCGYPLLSRAFKVIDKTFKELQEERDLALKLTDSEGEPELQPRMEPPVEPAMPPPTPMPPKPIPVTPPAPMPSIESQLILVTPPPPMPLIQSEPPPAPVPPPEPILSESPPVQSVPPPQPEPAPEPVQPAVPSPPSPPQDEIIPEPAPLVMPPPVDSSSPPTAASPPPPPAQKPELVIEPEPPPEPTIKLEDIQDGMEISAEQIDALFRVGKDDANAALIGKTLIIKGIVEKVFVREQLDIRYIMLTGARKTMAWSLRCTFNKETASKLAGLQEGQWVVVQGKYEGISKNIIFKDCVLV